MRPSLPGDGSGEAQPAFSAYTYAALQECARWDAADAGGLVEQALALEGLTHESVSEAGSASRGCLCT